VPVREGVAAFGEIGLTGRLRPAAQSERRLEECAKLGVLAAIAPEGTRSRSKIRVSASATLRDGLRAGLEHREKNPRKSA
jgi:predicted ATP-dependent serine protease